ncbi:MAG: hypothetical protein ABIO79_12270 [Ferruginibacter sp.]
MKLQRNFYNYTWSCIQLDNSDSLNSAQTYAQHPADKVCSDAPAESKTL